MPGGTTACGNGGTCSVMPDGNVRCDCTKNYNGSRCEKGLFELNFGSTLKDIFD